MIQVLGIKRILILIVLLAANIALGAATYMYVFPENEGLERQLRSTRAQIAAKRAESDRLRNDFQQIQQQKERFEDLQAAGFMSDQNRLVARRRILSIQEYTKVLRASYNISSANVVGHKATDGMGYVILSTPIRIGVEAIDDLDFYSFIYWMENAFPGHMSIQSVTLERVLDVNEATLRQIGSGISTTLIRGNLDFVWRTMVPEGDVRTLDEFGSGDF